MRSPGEALFSGIGWGNQAGKTSGCLISQEDLEDLVHVHDRVNEEEKCNDKAMEACKMQRSKSVSSTGITPRRWDWLGNTKGLRAFSDGEIRIIWSLGCIWILSTSERQFSGLTFTKIRRQIEQVPLGTADGRSWALLGTWTPSSKYARWGNIFYPWSTGGMVSTAHGLWSCHWSSKCPCKSCFPL